MLTPHFAGYFGYSGPVLHIAPHPLLTCCRSLKRDGEDEAWKTRKEYDFFCFLQHASVTSSSAPLPPLHALSAHFSKMGLNWLIFFLSFSHVHHSRSYFTFFHFVHSLFFFALGLTALVGIWFTPIPSLSSHYIQLLDNIVLLLCWIMENNICSTTGHYYWLISQ